MNKTVSKIIISSVLAAVLILICVVGYFTLPWILIGMSAYTSPNPPMPETIYGEFPYRVEIEYNGERIVEENVIICEFDGFDWNESVGRHRIWKGWLASEHAFESTRTSKIILLDTDEFTLYYRHARPDFLMGDPNFNYATQSYVGVSAKISPNKLLSGQEEFMEYFGIKIISIEETPPIVNSFR